jgi:hypothetical protein
VFRLFGESSGHLGTNNLAQDLQNHTPSSITAERNTFFPSPRFLQSPGGCRFISRWRFIGLLLEIEVGILSALPQQVPHVLIFGRSGGSRIAIAECFHAIVELGHFVLGLGIEIGELVVS